jgi:L-ribulokinase
VIDDRLPSDAGGRALGPDWAVQDPADYRRVLAIAVPEVLRASGVDPADVIGIGVAATSCTVLPTRADGTPLCETEPWRGEPHAWVKLWKHHAAQAQADRIDAALRTRDPDRLQRYGGRTSSEWLFAKLLHILDEAPAVLGAAERFLELGDWVVWQLTGIETRNATAAGYKAMWDRETGYPADDVLDGLDPRLAAASRRLLHGEVRGVGPRAGTLQPVAATMTGLRPGTPVAIAGVDAHVAVPGVTVTTPGRMVVIAGTSTCHLVLDPAVLAVPGVGGVVPDGIVPGMVGYEAGQPAVGDMLGWYVEHAVPPAVHSAAEVAGVDVHTQLQRDWASSPPGAAGLVALDWWNGNRSVLADSALSGVLVGLTVTTTPADVYRALVEATAFGSRVIVEAFGAAGVDVHELVACGGLIDRSPAVLQLYADVLDRPIRTATSTQATAVGAAILGAVAAGAAVGGHDTIDRAAGAMAHLAPRVVQPEPARVAGYDRLFRVYADLHDHFGRGGTDALHRLHALRRQA